MKKTPLLAAAVFAAAVNATAHAQTSVQIYGVVDIGITRANGGTSLNPGRGNIDSWGMQQGNASRLGFKGTEDLGGGNYAAFQIENRFFADSGQQDSGALFKGLSVLKLGNPQYGELYLGRDVVPAYYLTCTSDPTCWSYTSQPGQAFAWANYNGSVASDNSGIRRNNSIGYRTPKMNGFSSEIAYTFGEGARSNNKGLNVQYNNGPVWLGVGYDGYGEDDRLYILTAGYHFGFVRPLLTIAQARGGPNTPNHRGKSENLAFVFPTSTGRVFTGVGHLKENQAANRDLYLSSVKYYVGGDYYISKRTMLYANAGTAKTETMTRSTAFDVGIKHSF